MKNKKYILVILFAILISGGLFAQPGHGGGNDNGGGFGAPIDGGLVALVAVGVAYGMKKNIKENK